MENIIFFRKYAQKTLLLGQYLLGEDNTTEHENSR